MAASDVPMSPELEQIDGEIQDIFRALQNGFQKIDKIKDSNRQRAWWTSCGGGFPRNSTSCGRGFPRNSTSCGRTNSGHAFPCRCEEQQPCDTASPPGHDFFDLMLSRYHLQTRPDIEELESKQYNYTKKISIFQNMVQELAISYTDLHYFSTAHYFHVCSDYSVGYFIDSEGLNITLGR
ncbi:hypothetical protein ZWY2020_043864 [Hordeum vulgare]|nr:hypothetical protein ZWY2020_043864 [Hordeum vulgare]